LAPARRTSRDLYSRELIQSSKLNATERDAAALEGDIGRIDASIAETRGRIAEIEVEILAVEQNLRREVATELGELNARIAEYEERRTAALDEIRRLDLVAPISGTVHELAIRTRRGCHAGPDGAGNRTSSERSGSRNPRFAN